MFELYCGWTICETRSGVLATNTTTNAQYTFPDTDAARLFIDEEDVNYLLRPDYV